MLKEVVNKAYNFSKVKHEGQVRKFSGLPYFSHPKYVARIIEELTNDPAMVAVALLHDVLEDTDATLQELEEEFGQEIAELVKELTNPEKMLPNKKLYLADKLANQISDKALLIKLADRYHNVLFLESDLVSVSFIKKYYYETMFILKAIKTSDRKLTEEQLSIYEAINSIMKFIGLRQKLEKIK